MSLTPLSLQNDFSRIHKSFVPDQNQRGRLFEAAIARLTEWWAQTFFHVNQSGHIRNRTFDDVQTQIADISLDDLLDELENDEVDGEVIRSSKSLMKHALMQSGSRDTSAQLFTALCRGLQIPARLVVSLQSVPWQAGVGKSKLSVNKKKDDTVAASSSGSTSSKGKGKETPTVTLRKQKSKGRRLGSSPAPSSYLYSDPTITPPVFWTEVFSRPDARWLPVDPIRNLVNKRKVFDPSTSSSNPSASFSTPLQENRMVYVIAFEEDGYARDVTPRYAREYGAKVAKAQEAGGRAGGGGKGRKEWWESVLGIVTRPYRLVSFVDCPRIRIVSWILT
jgi:xeroderma pigmentosum group C-complementing protein